QRWRRGDEGGRAPRIRRAWYAPEATLSRCRRRPRLLGRGARTGGGEAVRGRDADTGFHLCGQRGGRERAGGNGAGGTGQRGRGERGGGGADLAARPDRTRGEDHRPGACLSAASCTGGRRSRLARRSPAR